jgi:hypothetical protein
MWGYRDEWRDEPALGSRNGTEVTRSALRGNDYGDDRCKSGKRTIQPNFKEDRYMASQQYSYI